MNGLPRPDDIERSILVTHKNCLDGAGCAIMFLRAGGLPENIRYVSAGTLERFVKRDPAFVDSTRFLIIADLGLNDPKYSDHLEARGGLVLIDHHRTSLHMVGRRWAYVGCSDGGPSGGEACGTELLRRYLGQCGYLGPTMYDAFVLAAIIDDHDRWLRRDPNSDRLALLCTFVGQEDIVRRFVNRAMRNDVFSHPEFEMLEVLTRRRDEQIAEDIRRAHVVDDVRWPGHPDVRIAYVVTDNPNTSLLLHRLGELYPDVDATCQVMVGSAKVSMRGVGGFDVAEFAARYGGGGHSAAAGHLFGRDLIEDLIEEIHDRT